MPRIKRVDVARCPVKVNTSRPFPLHEYTVYCGLEGLPDFCRQVQYYAKSEEYGADANKSRTNGE